MLFNRWRWEMCIAKHMQLNRVNALSEYDDTIQYSSLINPLSAIHFSSSFRDADPRVYGAECWGAGRRASGAGRWRWR